MATMRDDGIAGWKWGRATLAALMLAAGAAWPAWCGAQQVPPYEVGNKLVNVKRVAQRVEMRDAATNTPILLPKCFALYDDYNRGAGLQPNITIRNQPAGFDVVLEFDNTTGAPVALGRVRLGTFTLGPDMTYQQVWNKGNDVSANISTFIGQAWVYPAGLYAPVFIMRNSSYAVGISMQYPLMQYKHDVYFGVASIPGGCAAGEGGQGWELEMRLSSSPADGEGPYNKIYAGAVMQPGERRTYVASVRVTDKPEEWVRTLTPYRDYFQATYGPVKYQRETTPVMAVTHCDAANITDENPRGFGYPSRRPDIHGWGPWGRFLANLPGWPATMLWTPSGIYRNHRENNFPPQFTGGWLGNEKLMSATDPVNGLSQVKNAGRQLGLWWGRAAQTATQWDTAAIEDLDPDNPEHTRLAFEQLDLAVRAGATMIGLDAFDHNYMRVWKQYEWIQRMRERAPGMRFIIEPISCDVMHLVAGTYIENFDYEPGRPRTDEDLYTIKGPMVLADLLVPGHETWGVMSYHTFPRYGYPVTPARVQRDVNRLASYGYRPVIYSSEALTSIPQVAESWKASIPLDIQPRQEIVGPLPPGSPGAGGGSGGSPASQPGSGGEGGSVQAGAGAGGGGITQGQAQAPPVTQVPRWGPSSRVYVGAGANQSDSRKSAPFFSRRAIARALAMQKIEAMGPDKPQQQATVPEKP